MLLFKRLEIYTPVFDYGGSVAYVVTFGLGFIFDIICALTNALTICISWCVGWSLFICKQISGLEKAEDQAFTYSIEQHINSIKVDDPNIEKSSIDTLETVSYTHLTLPTILRV